MSMHPRRASCRSVTRPLARLAAGLLLVPCVARAQATGTRLGDLYERVLLDNPRIAATRALARAAEARVPAAKRPADPQVQFGLMNYTLPGLAPMPSLGMTQLQVMQMVPLGGKLALAGRAAGAQAASADARAEDVRWELRVYAAMAFYDLYAADRQLAVERETLRLLQDAARIAESMYRVGVGQQSDVLRAQVEVARMAADTLRMQAMRSAMTARLAAVMNAERADVSPVLPAFPDALPALAWLDSVAERSRPMIRAGLEEVRAANARATLARRELLPDIAVGVQYARGRSDMIAVGADGMLVREGRTESMGSLMIGASIPLFARSRQLQMRAEMDAMKAMAVADVRAMRAETRGKIGEAYAALVRARHLARLHRSTVLPQAEATVASALSAYRAGSVDFMTLLDGRMTVNRYREDLARLEADEGKAWAELEMLTGRELLDARATASDPMATATRERAERGAR